MGYKLKDILKDVQKSQPDSQPDKASKGHLELIQKFQKAAELKVWPDELIDSYLYNNPIAGVSQAGAIFKNEVDFLKKPENWKGIADLLQKIVKEQDCLKLGLYDELAKKIKELLQKVKESEGKKRNRNPQSAIHRMVFSLLPNLFTTIASEDQLNIVCDFIEGCDDYDGESFQDKNYYEKSHVLHELLKTETGKDDDEITAYAWQLRNKIVGLAQYVKLLQNNRNLILTGAPGTGKTFLAQEIAKALGVSLDSEQYGFVQFHPSYDYTDFVEGLRPEKKGTDTIGFERKDGIFMDFCRKALKGLKKHKEENKGKKDKEILETAPKYVFIIDEINRGEMSKILGELFFSIDPGYRGEKGKVSTQYSNLWKKREEKKTNVDSEVQLEAEDGQFDGDDMKFYVPENVYIIGTMNDIDRSVESMDFAMRRRFAFKEVLPEDRIDMIREDAELKDAYPDISKRMSELNNVIDDLLGPSYQIGASYFLKLKNYKTKRVITKMAWTQLWDNHLKGVLFEYFRGLPTTEQEKHMNTLAIAFGVKENPQKKTKNSKEKNNNSEKQTENGED